MSIEEYEFADIYKPKVMSASDAAVTLNTESVPWIALFRCDVIALAQHFEITKGEFLKQHDIALLNSLIADFVKGSVPFEDVVASRLNSLELEK